MQQNIQLHRLLISADKPGFKLIFSCLKMKLFRTFWVFWGYHLSKISKIVFANTLKYSQLISYSDSKKILLTTKIVRLNLGHYATKY